MGWRHRAVGVFNTFGGPDVVGRWFGRHRLTVLAYHRVTDHASPEFVGFVGNVSASPEAFDDQMRMVAARFHPVSIEDVVAAVDGTSLPERAALVTFDDGYRDNLDEALPILEDHSIPATVFLATDHIGSARPFWWDHAAWTIAIGASHPPELPLLGPVDWADRARLASRWVREAKTLPNHEKLAAITALAEAVGAPDPGTTFASTHLDWDAVRSMMDRGITFGAHTCSHPILSRVDPDEAVRQVRESIEVVAQRTGRPPLAFAYPNGLTGDFPDVAVHAVAAAGVPTAFTLVPGPARRRELLADPLQIRRIYIHHHDDRARFAAKLAGVPRFVR